MVSQTVSVVFVSQVVFVMFMQLVSKKQWVFVFMLVDSVLFLQIVHDAHYRVLCQICSFVHLVQRFQMIFAEVALKKDNFVAERRCRKNRQMNIVKRTLLYPISQQ